MDETWLDRQTKVSFARLDSRIEDRFSAFAENNPNEWQVYKSRLLANFQNLFRLYLRLYKDQYDFFFHFEDLLFRITQSWIERSEDLKAFDKYRMTDPLWFQSNLMLGGVCYVDLFTGNLKNLRAKLPYIKELGITYLHLMPLFKVPDDENDGGYAVSSYREINPKVGTIEDLITLARGLRQENISLALDLVFNHTSDEHDWALKALNGDPDYQEYYHMFPDREMPDAYEKHLREIFPEEHIGTFTYREEINRWVWTTFHEYQWDLNYKNPVVFNNMVDEMLFLANLGVEVLRLDAVAFTWKKLGTNCENLPEAHILIQAFNSVARIAAPALLFLSEAIVHPNEVAKYIQPYECQLSYNPLQMALIWNSLATREVRLLNLALQERNELPEECAWINYIRVHDDIGWTFSDEDAARLHINGFDHRQFLNQFYSGRFPGSFARGLPFQENSQTGDARISGTTASLAGLEKAMQEKTIDEVELALKRILLLFGITMTTNGIPLIYLGDEVGTLNDYSYTSVPLKVDDSRWVHRSFTDWEKLDRRHDPKSIEGRLFLQLQELIRLRKQNTVFSGIDLEVMDTDNEHVLGYVRINDNSRALIFANFSEQEQKISANILRLYGLNFKFTDMMSGKILPLNDFELSPYQFLCLKA